MSKRSRDWRWHEPLGSAAPATTATGAEPMKSSEPNASPPKQPSVDSCTRGPDHRATPAPAVQAPPPVTTASGADEAGPWERWTHHLPDAIDHVADVRIVGIWPPDTTRGLPERIHAAALALGLEYQGPVAGSGPAPEPVEDPPPVELPRAPAGGWEVWTHHLDPADVRKVGHVDIGHQKVNGKVVEWPWCPGERRGLPADVHDQAIKMGLVYLGPAATPAPSTPRNEQVAELLAENARLRARIDRLSAEA